MAGTEPQAPAAEAARPGEVWGHRHPPAGQGQGSSLTSPGVQYAGRGGAAGSLGTAGTLGTVGIPSSQGGRVLLSLWAEHRLCGHSTSPSAVPVPCKSWTGSPAESPVITPHQSHNDGAAASQKLLLKLGGSRPFSPPQIISLMQKHGTKTLRLAVIITCKYFQTIRSGRGGVCSLGQSYTGFRLFTTRLIS